jgi:hypothetical protein
MGAAPIITEDPEHIETAEPAFATGSGFTVITTELDLEHPEALVSVSV